MSSSTAKILRKPARKIACESATITRMNCSLLSMDGGATLTSPVLKAALAMSYLVWAGHTRPTPFAVVDSAAFKTIFVNHHAYPATPILLIAADHASSTLNLHICIRSDHFCGQRNCEAHGRADGYVHVVVKQHAIGGNIVGFGVALPRLRFDMDGKFDRETRRALHFGIARSHGFRRAG